MDPIQQALKRLKDGNERFVSGKTSKHSHQEVRESLVEGQTPFAVILGCSDSRAPAELVFDQGLGDLFVIRVAGNVVAPSLVGSVEFAVSQLGTPLVVVMGHTRCGAVTAAVEEMRKKADIRSPNLLSIVDRIRPSIDGILAGGMSLDDQNIVGRAIETNVRQSVYQLKHSSAIIEEMVMDGSLGIVGAEYALESGQVRFFEDG